MMKLNFTFTFSFVYTFFHSLALNFLLNIDWLVETHSAQTIPTIILIYRRDILLLVDLNKENVLSIVLSLKIPVSKDKNNNLISNIIQFT